MPLMFDLDTVAVDEREPALRDLLEQNPVPIDVSTGGVDRLRVATTADFFGSLFMVSCSGRGAMVHRDEKRVGQDHERTMMLSVVASGHSVFRHNNTITDATRGDIVPYSSMRPYSATFDDVAKHTFMIDYTSLGLPERAIEYQLGRSVSRRHTLGHIVTRYLIDLGTNAVYLPEADRRALERPTLELLRALFTTTAGDDDRAREHLHASLDVRLIEYLKMHLRDPELSVARLAREHGISERYVYTILARNGITFADWVRAQRLHGAAADLARTTTPQQSIAAIAHTWGFPDHANFTRAFRRTHGMSPREYRTRRSTDDQR
ncbi:AraC family transcriptional regulator [Nocardia sp.]|uniref:AraC family transcriptional regulator n=1 Tax=Nocardia sp. TaxID=1821 RepID=UPI00258B85EC|nr:AraC family transcriptional regulator [Nocardia sp.]